MSSLNTDINIEDKWYGFASLGRHSGAPSIFLYYGDEGVDKNYTVNSITKEFDGWNWSSKIDNYGTHIVYTGIDDADPLERKFEDEIVDFLQIQTNDTVRVVTSGEVIPSDEIDEAVDYYTVLRPEDDYEGLGTANSKEIGWFSKQLRRYDNVDFVFGLDGYSGSKDELQDISRLYRIPDERMWLYPHDGRYKNAFDIAKQLGYRMSLPPTYHRRSLSQSENSDG